MPLAVVPYRKRKAVTALTRVARAHPYGRYATTALRVYNTGRAAAPFARAAIAAYRARRSNKRRKLTLRRNIGERIGTSVAKANEIYQKDTGLNTKALSVQPLLDITKGTTDSSTTQRLRDAVNFRGIKFCISWRNIATTPWNVTKLHCHIAVVSPKDDTGTVPTTNFFRSNGENSTRSVDFGIARTGMDMACLPINTDLYRVHKHMRFTLDPSASDRGYEKMKTFYMPLKRQIRYDSSGVSPIGTNMYLVQWCSFAEEDTAAQVLDTAVITLRLVQYFREPRGT